MGRGIHYRMAVEEPRARRIDVELVMDDLEGRDEQVLCMPVWIPGSYKVREYSQFVLGFEALGEEGQALEWTKRDKASWHVDVRATARLTVRYQVYAHQISPRFNHVDDSHGFINPVATCVYPEGELDRAVEAHIEGPEGWEIHCGLEQVQPGVLRAEDFDEWFDSPIEMGDHQTAHFEVQGKEHRLVGWSQSEVDFQGLCRDLPAIIEEHARLFGEIPYERYVFINHILADKWGGLEHRHSSVNLFSPTAVNAYEVDDDGGRDEDYLNVLRLLSHEHFHAYHVKRLRPRELGPFDYQRENYTPSLWAVEGVTSYYDSLQVMRAGLMKAETYLEGLQKRIESIAAVPGRFEQSLEEASFDAWIGLYRRDENTVNSTVSYYSKGEVAVWLIDLWIRTQSGGQRSMDDVMRWMWQRYVVEEGRGFAPREVEQAVREVAGADPAQVFEDLVYTAAEIDYESYLTPLGLTLDWEESDEGWVGIRCKKGAGDRAVVKSILRHSPAEAGGLAPGDELVAIDGRAVGESEWKTVVAGYGPGVEVEFHVIRRGHLHALTVEIDKAPAKNPSIRPVESMTETQRELLEGWLGTSQWEQG